METAERQSSFAFFLAERELSWNGNWNLLVHGYVQGCVLVFDVCPAVHRGIAGLGRQREVLWKVGT